MNSPSAGRKAIILAVLVCMITASLPGSIPPPTGDEGEGSVEISVKLPRDSRLILVVALATLAMATIPSANVSLVVAASIIAVEQLFPVTAPPPQQVNQPTEPQSMNLGPASGGTPDLAFARGDLSKQRSVLEPRGLFAPNGLRGYILNTALSQKLPNGQQGTAPNLVDFVNLTDFSPTSRVDIDLPSDAFYEPQDMALTNDGRLLVVVSKGADPAFFPNRNPPSHLTIVDTATAKVVKRINLSPTDWPVSLALSPDGRLAYVSSPQKTTTSIDGAAIVVVDLQTNAIASRLPLPFAGGSGSGEIVITPDGALLLVLNALQFLGPTSRPGIAVIDTRTLTITATIGGIPGNTDAERALREASQLTINPSGTTAYAADAPTPQFPNDFSTFGLAVIDVATATVTHLVPIPGAKNHGIDDVQVSSDGRYITHTDGVSGLVSVVDAVSLEVLYQTDAGDAVLTKIAEGP